MEMCRPRVQLNDTNGQVRPPRRQAAQIQMIANRAQTAGETRSCDESQNIDFMFQGGFLVCARTDPGIDPQT